MEIKYFGANCIKISDRKVSLVIDDNLAALGLKTVTNEQDVVIFTADMQNAGQERFIINGPGEYEISEISIKGIPARAHTDKDGLNATIYSIKINDFNIVITGHIYAGLSDDQLENIGVVDVLIIPVGNTGYTLDADEAVGIIKKIEPKIVIPTHYQDEGIKYEVPQADARLFLNAIGISEPEYQESLVLKDRELGDKTRLVLLKRQVAK